jgi:hypothetical protein
MTKLLKKAFDKISKLPENEQDIIATFILEELKSDERWNKMLAGSQDILAKLADEALAEHRAGKTKRLNPDKL